MAQLKFAVVTTGAIKKKLSAQAFRSLSFSSGRCSRTLYRTRDGVSQVPRGIVPASFLCFFNGRFGCVERAAQAICCAREHIQGELIQQWRRPLSPIANSRSTFAACVDILPLPVVGTLVPLVALAKTNRL